MTRYSLVFAVMLPAAAHAADLSVDGAFARATPGGGPGAAYVAIHGGEVGDRLIGATSPVAGHVGLHTMLMQGSMMRMREVDAIDVPAGATVTLAPGGLHLMLEGLGAPLRAGETVALVLRFEHAGERRVEVPVLSPGATHAP